MQQQNAAPLLTWPFCLNSSRLLSKYLVCYRENICCLLIWLCWAILKHEITLRCLNSFFFSPGTGSGSNFSAKSEEISEGNLQFRSRWEIFVSYNVHVLLFIYSMYFLLVGMKIPVCTWKAAFCGTDGVLCAFLVQTVPEINTWVFLSAVSWICSSFPLNIIESSFPPCNLTAWDVCLLSKERSNFILWSL